jgi:hypothetical protein
MTTPLTRSFVSVTYLMGARGAELGERTPEAVARLEAGLLRGLQSEERSERTRFLAAAVRDLTSELSARALQPSPHTGDDP